jgi:hypothetical protein
MNALQRIKSIMASVLKYGALAAAAVAQVQAEVGSSGGDSGVQQNKKQLAVTYVLAAAHAGEAVPNSTVQEISAIVDLTASTAKALGLFGKSAAASGSVSVPGAPPV